MESLTTFDHVDFSTLYVTTQLLTIVIPIKYLKKPETLTYGNRLPEIFFTLFKFSLATMFSFKLRNNPYFPIMGAVILLYFLCLCKGHLKDGSWDKIVYNSVVILNTLWYVNRNGIDAIHIAFSISILVAQITKTIYQIKANNPKMMLSLEFINDFIANTTLTLYVFERKFLFSAIAGGISLILPIFAVLIILRKQKHEKLLQKSIDDNKK